MNNAYSEQEGLSVEEMSKMKENLNSNEDSKILNNLEPKEITKTKKLVRK